VLETRFAWLVLLLLVAAAVVGLIVKVVPVPYVSALALLGLGAGSLLGPGELHLTQSLILFVLLPGLLFEAAYNLSWRRLGENMVAVVALATAGVLLTTAVVALLGHAALGLAVPVAILFGAMVAPTDPVAVVAVFRRLHVPDRLVNLIEAESLLNDGTGVVLFTIAVAAVAAGPHVSVAGAALDFLREALGGLALGAVLGLVLSRLTRRVDDFQIEITLTAIAAYGSYLLADQAHLSGILAVVAAGLVVGNYGRPRGMSDRTQQAVGLFWDYVAFALNSAIFILIGLDVTLVEVVGRLGVVLAAAAIALLARAVAVYVLIGLLHLVRSGVPLRWQHLIVWSGMRGAIAVALALSLPVDDPRFTVVRALVYGVALTSILVQGATIGPLTRVLLRARRA
jgi:CPA1 family monovalent cation:H+ antiporter